MICIIVKKLKLWEDFEVLFVLLLFRLSYQFNLTVEVSI